MDLVLVVFVLLVGSLVPVSVFLWFVARQEEKDEAFDIPYIRLLDV